MIIDSEIAESTFTGNFLSRFQPYAFLAMVSVQAHILTILITILYIGYPHVRKSLCMVSRYMNRISLHNLLLTE